MADSIPPPEFYVYAFSAGLGGILGLLLGTCLGVTMNGDHRGDLAEAALRCEGWCAHEEKDSRLSGDQGCVCVEPVEHVWKPQ